MSETPKSLTLLQLVKQQMPDLWAAYRVGAISTPPWQGKVDAGEALASILFPEIRESRVRAKAAYAAIAYKLKELLPAYKVVADDANGKPVQLVHRHWADAVFELENSAIRHGDQRWTNVAVCEVAKPQRVSGLGIEQIRAKAKTIVDRIERAGRRLGRKDFDSMLKDLSENGLQNKETDRLWRELAPSAWRKPGKPVDGLLVSRWREFADDQPT